MTGTDHLKRWGETLISGALAIGLLWVGLHAAVAGAALGWVLATLGALAGIWLWVAWGRARLGGAPEGLGQVVIDERRIAFLGPEGASAAALDELWTVEAAPLGDGAAAWRLRPIDGPAMLIPAGAHGAEALPEALSALPGFSVDRAADAFAELRASPASLRRRLVWRRGGA